MSRFYVGQRVRVVFTAEGRRPLLGKEATITAIHPSPEYACKGGGRIGFPASDCVIDFGNDEYGAQFSSIAPLTPPKSQELVSWDEMPCNRDGSYREVVMA